ncbi:hypothetical protein ACOMHN_024048 [Nucella lapillus]
MPERLLTLVLLCWWSACVGCARACPSGCLCQPEGRGQSVQCHGEQLPAIIPHLPHNTARLQISGVTLLSLGAADLKEAPMSIQHLTITNSSLQGLQESAFSVAFTSLQELDLSDNRLKVISQGAFSGLSSLRLLNLSRNDFDTLGSCLEPLVSLQQLDLSYNIIHHLPPSTLHAQSSLRYLRLDGNKFRSLDGDTFHALSFLTELRIQNCSISVISESFLSTFPRLRVLDLSNNRLKYFPSFATFKKVGQLQHLYLQDNRLLQLERSQFDGLRMVTLSLAGNNIGALAPEAFSGLEVKDLDLSQNKLMELSGESLQPLAHRLQSLNLAYNPIRVLKPEMFKNLARLERLNVSACSVKHIPAEIFSTLYNLRTLDVAQNHLTNISKALITVFSRLVRVSVQPNPWHCDCHIAPFRTWLRSRQSIHKLVCPYGQNSHDCTSSLQCVSPEKFKGRLVFNLASPSELQCGGGVIRAGLPVPVQISIVLGCLLFAFGMLFLTMYLWKRGRTRKELQHFFHQKRKGDSHEEDEEEGERIEPFFDCDNESLKESHRSFVFRQFFDQMVTDPKLMDPPSPSQVDPSESELQAQPKLKDSMYSSNPSLYETSHKSCSVVVVGIESAV